ncbi:ATP-dependent DNA helicase [Bosea sp. RAC05]|uniref:ATP-dependent DNA helicase n=1 Tax=Bosea sp. RAC05 TaxID=1842539 RepID=UPI00083DF8B2|nr:helicase C-terminal domain-containing protein [Bosea sp. RAC05]AOG02940.1 hypothetical protein BSY19_4961 [Bosea sp. RAC05]
MAKVPHLDLASWRADAPGIIRAVFADGGSLSQVMPGYAAQPEQSRMAQNCAATIVAGKAEAASISFQQASTGIGKGIAYGVPLALHAVLTGGRVMVATHTINLQRQWTGKDGRIVADVVDKLTGIRPIVALRRSQRSFVSCSRTQKYAEMLRAQASVPGVESPGLLLMQAAALDELANYVQDVMDVAARSKARCDEAVDDFEGLIDTFADAYPDQWALLASLQTDRICINPQSSKSERLLYERYAARSRLANVLVTTHAAAVIDLKIGSILDGISAKFEGIVFDEADRLPDVAKSIIASTNSIGAIGSDIAAVLQAAAADEVPLEIRKKIAESAIDLHTKIDQLFDHLRVQDKELKDRVQLEVQKSDPVSVILSDVSVGLQALSAAISRGKFPIFHDVVEGLEQQVYHIDNFLQEVGLEKSQRYSRPVVSFSPVRSQPSISLIPRSHKMLVSRLWTGTRSRAKSIIFTSATLTAPGKPPERAFDDMIEMVGLDRRRELIRTDLSGVYAPETFGTMTFMLAHPSAPVPERSLEDEPPSIAYTAHAVGMAAATRTTGGNANVLVLVKSHEAGIKIADKLDRVLPSEVRARKPGEKLSDLVDWFKAERGRILVTAGAWEGLDIPGWIDHLVIHRLPFEPPSGRFAQYDEGTSLAVTSMMRLLRQGIGRGIRRASDKVCVWICDPRFGMPGDLAAEKWLAVHPKAHPSYLACVEHRFQPALAKAGIIPIPHSGKREQAAKGKALA